MTHPDPAPQFRPFHSQSMGKQYNKAIKRKRREAYLKRRKAAAKAGKSKSKARK